jgi:hypothetical protein
MLFTPSRRFLLQPQKGGTLDIGGNSHHIAAMSTATIQRQKSTRAVTVVADYDVAADAKKRISLRNPTTKYFHVKALSNGCFLLEPRVLVSPDAIPARTRKMLEQSVSNLKRGVVSPPIDLTPFLKG